MYRFALRGRWLVGHVVVLLLAALFVRLGIWQLHRRQERQAANARIEARLEAPAALIAELVDPRAAFAPDVVDRQLRAVGRYDRANEVLVRSRSLQGASGKWVLTPLRLADGTAVIVNRGWVPLDDQAPLSGDAAAPSGQVTVRGLARASQQRGPFGPTDPRAGRLRELNRVDLPRLQRQLPYDVYPVWLQLQVQSPGPRGNLPALLPGPDLSGGPHFSYAMQWFAFAAVGLVGWPLLIRRSARDAPP